jgi:hypothetical protein
MNPGDDDEDELIDEEMAEDVEAAPPPSDAELRQVRVLAQQYLDLEAEIERLEEVTAAKKLALRTLKETALPMAMTALGMTDFGLVGGGKVVVSDLVRAGITEANRPLAFAALEKNNHGDIIKHEITVLFGKGEEKWAAKFLADLAKRKKPLNVSRRDFVEWQTLGKLAKELVAACKSKGLDPKEALPDDLYRLIGIYEARVAEVKLPKEKKKA